MSLPTDCELAIRARRGESEAFGELVRRYQGLVFNVCYRLVGERGEAEDMAQEAFLRVFQRLQLYDVERPFGPWARQVAANLCLNRMPTAQPAAFDWDDERDDPPASPESSPEAQRERNEGAEALRRALLELPPRYRAVIELRHFQDLSYAEIAAQLEIPLSDVKSDLFRARQLLAKKLRPYA